MTQEKNTASLPRRSEVDPKYTWDLTHIFPTDEAWEEAFAHVRSLLPRMKEHEGRVASSAERLLQALRLRDELSNEASKVFVYAHLKKDEDSTNSTYVAYENRASSLIVEVESALSFIEPEILGEKEEIIRQYVQQNEELRLYEHALQKIMRQKKHVLQAREEAILAQAGELASAPSDIFTMINNADLTFPRIKDEKGEEQELTHGNYITFMENQSREVRKQAFQAMHDTYRQQQNTLAATLNASIKKDVFYARVRNYDSSLESALDQDNVPTKVYDNLIHTIHEHLPLFQRYMALRKKVLGVDELHLYDVYVPLLKEVEMKYAYPKAQELVLKALQPLGDDYVGKIQKGYEQGWIDVYENIGKRSGAYSSGTYGTPPYILLNYQETLDNVYTLAHELGHSIHSAYSHAEQPYVYANYTIFVAEVASTLNEALLTRYLLQQTTDRQKKMYILNHYLDGFRGTVFRQTMFAEFEKRIHEKVEQGEALTPAVLNEMYHDLNVRYFGQEMVVDEDIDIEWARIPHFYMTYYVYKYATGFAAATALSKQILEEGQPAVVRYLSFLKSGGSDYPIDLLKKAGVDMTSPEPIRQALQVFETTLDELEELLQDEA